MKTTTEVTTRPEAGKDGIVTNLTINWDGMSQDDIVALAQQALIVKLQGKWRKDVIPAGEHEVNATDFRVGVRAPKGKDSLESLLKKLNPEELAALRARLLDNSGA